MCSFGRNHWRTTPNEEENGSIAQRSEQCAPQIIDTHEHTPQERVTFQACKMRALPTTGFDPNSEILHRVSKRRRQCLTGFHCRALRRPSTALLTDSRYSGNAMSTPTTPSTEPTSREPPRERVDPLPSAALVVGAPDPLVLFLPALRRVALPPFAIAPFVSAELQLPACCR
jgi:hypothetical protein